MRSISRRLMSQLSSSEREHALKYLGIGPAAHLIRDAVLGERSPEDWFDPYADPDQPFRNFLSVLCSRLIANRWVNRLLRTMAWVPVILSFIEPPRWCDNETELALVEGTELDDFGTCGVILRARGMAVDGTENVQLYPNTSSMFLTRGQSQRVEAFCLGMIVFFMLLEFGKDGLDIRRFFQAGPVGRVRIFRLVLLICLFGAVCSNITVFSPFFRLLLLGTYLKSFQKELDSFMRMVSIFDTRLEEVTHNVFPHTFIAASTSNYNSICLGCSNCLLRLVRCRHLLRFGSRGARLLQFDRGLLDIVDLRHDGELP